VLTIAPRLVTGVTPLVRRRSPYSLFEGNLPRDIVTGQACVGLSRSECTRLSVDSELLLLRDASSVERAF
jgi:hypothetical protein